MKTKLITVIAVVASLFLIAAGPADAARGGRGGGGRGGGGHSGGHSGGFHGGGHGSGFHGNSFRGHGFRPARVVVGGRVFVGGWGWGPYWGAGPYWGYPYGYGAYGYGYGAPYYPPAYATPVVSEPQSYIQQSVPTNYWYYCEGARAYYPYVQECPAGWLTVVPQDHPK